MEEAGVDATPGTSPSPLSNSTPMESNREVRTNGDGIDIGELPYILQQQQVLQAAARHFLLHQHSVGPVSPSMVDHKPPGLQVPVSLAISAAGMSSQPIQILPSTQQLQVLLQQQSFLLQQQLQELYKKQQEQFHLQLLHQQQSSKAPKEHQAFLGQQLTAQQQRIHFQQQQQGSLAGPALPSPIVHRNSLYSGLLPAELHHQWMESGGCMEEVPRESRSSEGIVSNPSTVMLSSSPLPRTSIANGQACGKVGVHRNSSSQEDPGVDHPLFGHGVCHWPGCEAPCDDGYHFLKHLSTEHALDDRSTAQCRVQTQVVQQLELQLEKERERLQAMMSHLHVRPTKSQPPNTTSMLGKASPDSMLPRMSATPLTPATTPSSISPLLSPHGTLSQAGVSRRRHSEKFTYPLIDLTQNQEFYENADVRPPFTYASLIREAILETGDRQLTLNEIYNWFTRRFAFFRHNTATWKNAVRHNLSLHKCFIRVENVKGAVWTVDEQEFQKRKPQRMTGNLSLMKNMQPGFAYGMALNASLQAALGDTPTLPFLGGLANPMAAAAMLVASQEDFYNLMDHGSSNGDSLGESPPCTRPSQYFVKPEPREDDVGHPESASIAAPSIPSPHTDTGGCVEGSLASGDGPD
uniref:Fork-head domain-containing protein n=1 Tax=Eptatretus burgeri TaxID=7764 RepID=A0A8C4WVF1_EPTBU